MTLIVEDGTGRADAESYCDVAYADLYHSNLGNTAWASLDLTVKEQRLRKGFNFLGQKFRSAWKGYRASLAQRGDWPRVSVYLEDMASYNGQSSFAYMVPYNEIPEQVKNAQCELALISDPLVPSTLKQNKTMVKAGPVTVMYDQRSPQTVRYPVVTQLLQPFLDQQGVMVRLDR